MKITKYTYGYAVVVKYTYQVHLTKDMCVTYKEDLSFSHAFSQHFTIGSYSHYFHEKTWWAKQEKHTVKDHSLPKWPFIISVWSSRTKNKWINHTQSTSKTLELAMKSQKHDFTPPMSCNQYSCSLIKCPRLPIISCRLMCEKHVCNAGQISETKVCIHQGGHPRKVCIHQGGHPRKVCIHQGGHHRKVCIHQGGHHRKVCIHQGGHHRKVCIHQGGHHRKVCIHQGGHHRKVCIHQGGHHRKVWISEDQ